MSLTIFDLDNTLLAGDSDYLWGQFLSEQGIVDGDEYEKKNLEFYHQYEAGTLDIYEFLRFSLKPLTEHTTEQLHAWHEQFMQEKIRPIMQQKAMDLIQQHREQGQTLMIITATNSFVTRPIADALGIENLLATEPEFIDGRYTGNVSGIPCFKDGKVKRLNQWLIEQHESLQNSWFYSDSHNDIPLLEEVTFPVATDPDETLRQHALQHGWKIICLRE